MNNENKQYVYYCRDRNRFHLFFLARPRQARKKSWETFFLPWREAIGQNVDIEGMHRPYRCECLFGAISTCWQTDLYSATGSQSNYSVTPPRKVITPLLRPMALITPPPLFT